MEKHAHPTRAIHCVINILYTNLLTRFTKVRVYYLYNLFIAPRYITPPPPRRLAPSLAPAYCQILNNPYCMSLYLGCSIKIKFKPTTRVRQLRSGGCHDTTAATKCNVRPSQAKTQLNPVDGKACTPTKG